MLNMSMTKLKAQRWNWFKINSHVTFCKQVFFQKSLRFPWTQSVPDVAVSGSVLEEPSIRCLVLPADVASIFPQEFDLLARVAGVPQGVPQVFTWTRVRLDSLFVNHKGQEVWVSGLNFDLFLDCGRSVSMSWQLLNVCVSLKLLQCFTKEWILSTLNTLR